MLNLYDLNKYLNFSSKFQFNEKIELYNPRNYVIQIANYKCIVSMTHKLSFMVDSNFRLYIYLGILTQSNFRRGLNDIRLIDTTTYNKFSYSQYLIRGGTLKFIEKLRSRSTTNKMISIIIENNGITI